MTSYFYHSNDSFAQHIKISRIFFGVLLTRNEQLVPINRYAQIMSNVIHRATTVSKHVNLPYSAWVGTSTKLNVYLK